MQDFKFSFIYRANDKNRDCMNKKKTWKVGSLLSGALALLGFAGCSDNNNLDIPCLYGSPSINYRVFGTVTDTQGNPLEGIQVVMDNPDVQAYYDEDMKPVEAKRDSVTGRVCPDTVYTDKDGKFTSYGAFAINDRKLVVEFQDIDGEANGGEFQLKRHSRDEFDAKRLEEGEGFYAGEYAYSKTVELKRKGE